MSELHRGNHEHKSAPENLNEHQEKLNDIANEQRIKAAEAANEKVQDKLEHARKETAEHAISSNELEADKPDDKVPLIGNHQLLKKDAYKQILKRTQEQLSKPSRAFSQLIHNKTVESLSNVSAKTVARPSGFLGAGLGAFVGSLVSVYTSQHYGFRYNFGMFIALFVGGFIFGLLIELMLKMLMKR